MVLNVSHLNGSLVKSGEKWYNKTIKSGPPQNGERLKTMSELKKKKTLTAREKALDSLVAEIAELCFEDDEKLEKAVMEVEHLAALKTENGGKNPDAWAHTVPAIKNHIMIAYGFVKVEEPDRLAKAKAIAAKKKNKQNKQSKKVEA